MYFIFYKPKETFSWYYFGRPFLKKDQLCLQVFPKTKLFDLDSGKSYETVETLFLPICKKKRMCVWKSKSNPKCLQFLNTYINILVDLKYLKVLEKCPVIELAKRHYLRFKSIYPLFIHPQKLEELQKEYPCEMVSRALVLKFKQ